MVKKLFIPFLCWTILLWVVFRFAILEIRDADMWWHLAVGRFLVENQEFLREDIFSHTLFGHEWINFKWLSEILIYLVFKSFGFPGIYGAKIVLSLSLFGLLVWGVYLAHARGPGLFWLAWLGYWLIRIRFSARPYLITMNLMALFVGILFWARFQGHQVLKRIPWVLFTLMIFWVNIHGDFPYAIGLILFFNVGARWSREKKEYIGMLNRALVLTTMAIFINPFGVKIMKPLLTQLVMVNQDRGLVADWAFWGITQLPHFWFLLFLTVGCLLLCFWKDRKVFRFWFPILVVFGVYSIQAYRTTALLAFFALPFLAEMGRGINFSRWSDLARKTQIRIGWSANFLLVLFFIPFLTSPLPSEIYAWNILPLRASQFIKDQNIQGQMYNTYDFGGFLNYDLGPEQKIFQDGRYIFYPFVVQEHQFTTQMKDGITKSGWVEYLDSYNVDYAICKYSIFGVKYTSGDPPFWISTLNVMFPRSQWALVFWDDTAVIFLKRIPKHQTIIDKFEYKALWPYNIHQMQHLVKAGLLSPQALKADLEFNERQVGETGRGNKIREVFDF